MWEIVRGDTLLGVCRILLRVSVVAIIAMLIASGWGIAALLFFPSADLTAQLAGAPSSATYAVAAMAAIGMVILYLSLRFATVLGRIIATVGWGDPFDPANADRITRLAWLVLGIDAAHIALVPIGWWLSTWLTDLKGAIGLPFGGVVLALTLFVLARVFRHGAMMRDDLQGTV